MTQIDIPLKHPLMVQGSSVASLRLRRPVIRDLLAIRDLPDQAEQEIALVLALAQPALGRDDLLGLDLEDYRALQQALAGLMGAVAAPRER